MKLHLYDDANQDLNTETIRRLILERRCKWLFRARPAAGFVGDFPGQVLASNAPAGPAPAEPHRQHKALFLLYVEADIFIQLTSVYTPLGEKLCAQKRASKLNVNHVKLHQKLCFPADCWATANN